MNWEGGAAYPPQEEGGLQDFRPRHRTEKAAVKLRPLAALAGGDDATPSGAS